MIANHAKSDAPMTIIVVEWNVGEQSIIVVGGDVEFVSMHRSRPLKLIDIKQVFRKQVKIFSCLVKLVIHLFALIEI